jgi:hypothetical protein
MGIFDTLNRLVLGVYQNAGIGQSEAVEIGRALASQQVQIENVTAQRDALGQYVVQMSRVIDQDADLNDALETEVEYLQKEKAILQEQYDNAIERIGNYQTEQVYQTELDEVYRLAAQDTKIFNEHVAQQLAIITAMRERTDDLLLSIADNRDTVDTAITAGADGKCECDYCVALRVGARERVAREADADTDANGSADEELTTPSGSFELI